MEASLEENEVYVRTENGSGDRENRQGVGVGSWAKAKKTVQEEKGEGGKGESDGQMLPFERRMLHKSIDTIIDPTFR